MIESLLILNLLTLGIVGGLFYFYIQRQNTQNQERLETVVNLYEKVIDSIQAEKIHLTNCFLDKNKQPPLGTDIKAEREKRIEESESKKQDSRKFSFGKSPIRDAQEKAQQEYLAGVKR